MAETEKTKKTTNEVVNSVCGLCYIGCGILVHLENGRPVRIEGNPDSPTSKGDLCPKGLASLEYLYHPDRLIHPLERVGERGQGHWRRISWDEALDRVAEALAKAKQDYGAESVALLTGYAKGFQNTWLNRLGHAFEIPNIIGQGHVCNLPRALAGQITCGFPPFADFAYPPACIIVWGCNPAATYPGDYRNILRAISRDNSKLMVIDPSSIDLTERADMWLRLRPGSDLALALGMMNVVINEGLHDRDFVDKWTVGFDDLKAHIQDYTPERVAKITWLEDDMIKKAARFYVENKPACIVQGNGIDHNINSFQTTRALLILTAITGNLGSPGGNVEWARLPLPGWNSPEFMLFNRVLFKEGWRRRLSTDLLPFFPEVPAPYLVKAILEKDPYPIRFVYVHGCNPLLTFSHAQETYHALMEVDFLAVADLFMTPTAALADIVLPVASYLEYDGVVAVTNTIAHVQQKVAQVGECRSDYEIMSGLARRLGVAEYFWDSPEEALDYILKPAGLTFKEFREIGILSSNKQYRKHESSGFKTPSGKIELYSSQLKQYGYDPLPVFRELPETPHSAPELSEKYPLVFTSQKLGCYHHSGGRQIISLRGTNPEPMVSIHSQTADKLGITEGDWVYIETKRGRTKQKATLTNDIDPRVVVAAYGWWFPEKGISELYGWTESNINMITDDKPPYNREVGSTNLRGICCKVYKA